MNLYDLGPLILSHCIDFLRKREEGTKYHPTKDIYYLDSKMMARIIRHNGDFRATTDNSETTFFGKIINILIEMQFVDSTSHNETFEVSENNNFNRVAIDVKRVNKHIIKRGRKPTLVKEVIYEPNAG